MWQTLHKARKKTLCNPAWYNTAVSARQEVLNTELARLLCQHGLVALPEQRLQQGVIPDLLLPFRGFYTNRRAKVHK